MKFIYDGKELELILLTYSGSRLYNTHYEKGEKELDPNYVSDYDWKGIFIEKVEDKFDLLKIPLEEIEIKKDQPEDELNNKNNKKIKSKEEIDKEIYVKNFIKSIVEKKQLPFDNEDDMTLYEIEKFLDLSIKNNPNIFDILFVPKEKIIYCNKKGVELIKNRHLFLSQIVKDTFVKYAENQLARIKSHKKYLVKYPKIHLVQEKIELALKNKDIDHNFISVNFSGFIANALTTQKEKVSNVISYEEFAKKYSDHLISSKELLLYKRPNLIDYTFPKTLRGENIDMNKLIYNSNTNIALNVNDKNSLNTQEVKDITVRDFLLKYATFRPISKTQLNIFTLYELNDKNVYKNGIYTNEGKLKANPPEKIGDFVFQISVDEMVHKKDVDAIDKLWEWKSNRNEKRSDLEKHYGYDVKHALHLYRLILKAIEILKTEDYVPSLSGSDLKECLNIRDGKIKYEDLIIKIESIKNFFINLDSNLKLNPNLEEINNLKKELLFGKNVFNKDFKEIGKITI